jgi:hypothetical protein
MSVLVKFAVVAVTNGYLAVPTTDTQGGLIDWSGAVYAADERSLADAIASLMVINKLEGKPNALSP